METFSSEIGKKMRNAVKAKLIELGTEGGTAGYVDDELPDYVMIMVANKRSKQQMTSDLNLFLGNKTELFVTWLHEVLQKLQEVTVPAPTAKKRKSGQKEEVLIKKDKKTAKKEKKPVKKPGEHDTTDKDKAAPGAENTAVVLPPTGSITDAFAEELLVKAKHNLDVEADAASQIKKGKTKKTAELELKNPEDNDFDIPTISEISSTTGGGNNIVSSINREKDLAELAEIQKKIYAAKKHLKELGELKDQESDDEDFLRLRDDEGIDALHEMNATENTNNLQSKKQNPKTDTKEKSPIVFDKNDSNEGEKGTTPPVKNREHSPHPIASAAIKSSRNNSAERRPIHASRGYDRERRRETSPAHNRRSIHERLGAKPQLNETTRQSRREKELYVPAHRRQEARHERDSKPERWRSRERNENRRNERDRIEKSRERENGRDRERSEPRHTSTVVRVERKEPKESSNSEDEVENSRETTRHRVGSRVIVAPIKPTESPEPDGTDKPVNSVIKIKPRPAVSPSRQACKNLLLRAVAEAQRSTILTKAKPPAEVKKSHVKSRLGKTIKSAEEQELFTKTLRDRRLKRSGSNIGASTLFRRQTQNFIIKVDGELNNKRRRVSSQSPNHSSNGENEYEQDEMDDALMKESISYEEEEEQLEDYHSEDVEDDEAIDDSINEAETASEKTQFVVTLNDDSTAQKFRRRNVGKKSRSTSPPPQVSSSSSSLVRNHNNEPSSTTHFSRSRPRETRRSDIRSRLSKRPATPLSPSRANRLKERGSTNSSPSSVHTPPRPTVRVKTKDVKKIIIKNDTDDDESMSPNKRTPEKEREHSKRSEEHNKSIEKRRSPSLPATTDNKPNFDEKIMPIEKKENKHVQIKFDLDTNRSKRTKSRSRSNDRSLERNNGEEKRRISIRTEINNKYDNIPALSALESTLQRVIKPKERCKYHPNCTKQFCDFYHPTAPCKAFPNCKFADKCMYSHPKCKYDMACTNLDCNFSHSGQRNPNQLQPTAPPLSSSVVPVQNYKTISAATAGASSTMCKYYPNCTKIGCTFYHPKACRFGKNCINKLECNFYHHELQSSSKFKWVASAT